MIGRRRATAWGLALLLAAAHLVSFLDRSVLALVLEPIKADLHVGDAALGLLQGTAFALFYGLAAMPFGVLADRVDRTWLVAGGILLWSAATAAGGLAGSYSGLFVSRLLVGLGEAALVPAALAILADVIPKGQLGRATALFTAGASLGRSAAFAGGGLILGLLATRGGLYVGGFGLLAPWRGLLLLLALPGLLLAALILASRRHVPPPSGRARRSVAVPLPIRRRWIAHVGAGSLLLFASQSLLAWAIVYLGRVHGLPPKPAGLALGGIALIAAPLGHLIGGASTDALHARGRGDAAQWTMAAAMAAALPCLVAFALAGSASMALLCLGAAMLCLSAGSPAALAGVQTLMPAEARGRATAWFLAITTLIGAGCGPALVGMGTDWLGGGRAIHLALPLITALAALGGACLALRARAASQR